MVRFQVTDARIRARHGSIRMQKCDPPRLRQPQMLHARVKVRSPMASDPAKFHGKLFARIQVLAFLLIACY
ncbi:hypothetical protein BFN67_21105 [Pseudaminobacter manganicus]|uniref:Uncharacterized protein n=1 Tax=Manganibacter manganicus TaxID=1873176 RepID=A0A1V8RN29_9HYPH|nr:hypothetical protein BFN67_21105 [Pseudaminobacter manganicus]